jgi:hypothetical protein
MIPSTLLCLVQGYTCTFDKCTIHEPHGFCITNRQSANSILGPNPSGPTTMSDHSGSYSDTSDSNSKSKEQRETDKTPYQGTIVYKCLQLSS